MSGESRIHLLNGKVLLNRCGGNQLVASEPPENPEGESCCCCVCDPKKVYSWTQEAAGEPYRFPESVVCSMTDYRTCQKWQIVARLTRPGFPGYPRIVASGRAELQPDGSRCLIGLDPYSSHLGLKGYSIDYELWVMCNGQNYDSVPPSGINGTGTSSDLGASGDGATNPDEPEKIDLETP
jgi:hypothetical protein